MYPFVVSHLHAENEDMSSRYYAKAVAISREPHLVLAARYAGLQCVCVCVRVWKIDYGQCCLEPPILVVADLTLVLLLGF